MLIERVLLMILTHADETASWIGETVTGYDARVPWRYVVVG